jgi:hypothetical protein
MTFIEEDSDMDILWLAAGVVFFAASNGLVVFFDRLRRES